MKKLLFVLLSCSVVSISTESAFAQGLMKTAAEGAVHAGAGTVALEGALRSGIEGMIPLSQVGEVVAINRIRLGQAPSLSSLQTQVAKAAIAAQVPGMGGMHQVTVPGTGEILNAPGARTAEEAQNMAAMLRYLQHQTQIHQQLLDQNSEELAILQRRQKWLPINHRWREVQINSQRESVDYHNGRITEFKELLPRTMQAIREGQSLAQVMSIVYNKPVTPSQFYVRFRSPHTGDIEEVIAAPGAQTAEEANEMATLLNSLNNQAQFYDRLAMMDIEEAVSSVRKTASIVSTGSRSELRERFEKMRDQFFDREQKFRDEFNRVKTAIEVGQSLAKVKQLAYTGKIETQKNAPQFYVMLSYNFAPGIVQIAYYPAPGAKTWWEAWRLQELVLKADYEDPGFWHRHHGGKTLYIDEIIDGIENGSEEVALMAQSGYVPKEDGPFLLVEPRGDRIEHKWWSLKPIPAPGATSVTDAQQMQALLLQAYDISETIGFYFAYDDGAHEAAIAYRAVRDAIRDGKSIPEVQEIFNTRFIPLVAKF